MTAPRPEILYKPSKTIAEFQADRSFVRGLRGPVGSGKSVGATIDLFRQICEQPNGRFCVVRNTFRELMDTTLATWLQWLRPFGKMHYSSMVWTCNNGAEVLFRGLDKPADAAKLLSLELTSAWVNEAREVPKPIIDMLITRLGRWPSKREGGAKFFGLTFDTNSPDTFSWWHRIFEEERPEGWRQFVQPGGREPLAENLANLPANYYDRISVAKDQAWIDVYVGGRYGFIVDGRPVFPQYNSRIHSVPCKRDPNLPVIVGLDFGLTPAATFMQCTLTGQYRVIHEIVTEELSAVQFAELLGKELRSNWQGQEVEIWGDPAGEQRSQVDARTPFMVLKSAGINARPAPTQDPRLRVEAVVRNLTRLTMAGEPGLIIDPSCRYLCRGMAGGYKYRLMQISGEERFTEKPDKNLYSHTCESLEYALCGAGEVRATLGRRKQKPLDYSRIDQGVI